VRFSDAAVRSSTGRLIANPWIIHVVLQNRGQRCSACAPGVRHASVLVTYRFSWPKGTIASAHSWQASVELFCVVTRKSSSHCVPGALSHISHGSVSTSSAEHLAWLEFMTSLIFESWCFSRASRLACYTFS